MSRGMDSATPAQGAEARSIPEQKGGALPKLVAVMQRLLAPDGCPWDREQSHESLRKYVLEEACEVMDAIDEGSAEGLREELGDLLLQIVFHAELARAEGKFAIDDVIDGIVEKMVRRHPHVFGDAVVKDSEEVLQNWEVIKAKEKADRPLLGGLPRSLPALVRAFRVGEKVHRVGFDWPDRQGSRDKVDEEIGELDEAVAGGDPDRIEAELGDALFALVNFARHVGVDPEAALRRTTDEFIRRFGHVEQRARAEHGGFANGPLPLATLDAYWDEAKRQQVGKGAP